MLATPTAFIEPIRMLADLLSESEFVPDPAKDLMRPVSEILGVAEQLAPPLQQLATSSWNSLAAMGATRSIEEMGTTISGLVSSAEEIARVTAVAADIVVRGTIEVIAIGQEFLTRAIALGPALFTPIGQATVVGLAAEHLTRGIQVVERVKSELLAPTAELRQIAATIPAAPSAPGSLGTPALAAGSGGGLGGGAGGGAGAFAAESAAYLSPTERGGQGTLDETGLIEGAGAAAAGSGLALGSSGVVGGGVEVQLPDGSCATAPNEEAADAVRNALSQQGVPYSWGGTTPNVGFDCSGFTQWAYGQSGVEIPRLAQEQGVGVQVQQSELMPGDLAVWSGHVAMYIGNGQMVEAGDPVSVSGLRTTNLDQAFYGFYRPTGE